MIALFVLIIACINFMNLTTAKASRRIKEVGIKKVVGARRGTLILQYLGESMLLTFVSLFLAIVLVVVLLPHFNNVTGKQIILAFDSSLFISIAGITIVTGLIAAVPAFIFKFQTAASLKESSKLRWEVWIRKGL